MQQKNIIVAGITCLLVFSLILAAGCTSTNTISYTPTQPAVSGDTSIAGTWTTTEWDDGVQETKTLTINSDGTGTKTTEKASGKISIEPFTWTGTAPVFQFIFENGTDWDTYTLVNDTLIHDHSAYTRDTAGTTTPTTTKTETTKSSVSIAGTWTASEWDDGLLETKTLTINSDGTGMKTTEKASGKISIEPFTWTGTAPVFQFIFENGTDWDTYTLVNDTLIHDHTVYTKSAK